MNEINLFTHIDTAMTAVTAAFVLVWLGRILWQGMTRLERLRGPERSQSHSGQVQGR